MKSRGDGCGRSTTGSNQTLKCLNEGDFKYLCKGQIVELKAKISFNDVSLPFLDIANLESHNESRLMNECLRSL